MPSIFEGGQKENLRRAAVAAAPPGTAQLAIADPTWQEWFFQYVWQDKASDDAAHSLVEVFRDVEANDWTLGDLYRSFIQRDRGIPWPEDLKTRVHGVVGDAGEGDDEPLRREMSQAAVELLGTHYYPDFHTRVMQVAAEPAPTPPPAGPITAEWTRARIYMGGVTIESQLMPRAEFLGALQQKGAPDLNTHFTDAKTRCAAGQEGPSPAIVHWGSSWVGVAAETVRTQTPPYILLTLTAVFVPSDMGPLNRPRLQLLQRDEDSAKYTQCGPVVMVDPGTADVRYALVRWACQYQDGGDQARITRSGRKIKVRTVVPGYESDFEDAIRPVADRSIEWT